MTAIPHEFRVRLRQRLVAHFSEEELRTLCFDMGLDYADLPAQGRAGKTRELVAHLERDGRIPELVVLCRQLRPRVSWEDVSQATVEQSGPSHDTPAGQSPSWQSNGGGALQNRDRCLELAPQITDRILSHVDELAQTPEEYLAAKLASLATDDLFLASLVAQYQRLQGKDTAAAYCSAIQKRIQTENLRLLSLEAERNLSGIAPSLEITRRIQSATIKIKLLNLALSILSMQRR